MSEIKHLGDIEQLNQGFETRTPEEILAWAWQEFGAGLLISSSFQTQSVALLHMVSLVCPEAEVLFLDTGYHFPETLVYRDMLQELFHLKIRNVYPAPDAEAYQKDHTPLYLKDPDRCCYLRKVEPMARALAGAAAWVSGVRRDQTVHRQSIQIIELENEVYKIHPMANWTRRDLWAYISRHDLPSHPLFSQGYASIGCAPCTRPSMGDDERSGRWAGTDKKECGLHTVAIPIQQTDPNQAKKKPQ